MLLISDYRNLLEQTFNLTNFKLDGKIELQSTEDKQKAVIENIKKVRPDLL